MSHMQFGRNSGTKELQFRIDADTPREADAGQ